MHLSPALSSTVHPLKLLGQSFDRDRIARETLSAWREILHSSHWDIVRARLRSERIRSLKPSSVDLSGEAPKVTLASSDSSAAIAELCEAITPWRIGPFDIAGYLIDSEWRSNIKWDRLIPLLPSIEGKRIADVGCSNGYFLFRLAHFNPEIGIGFDPIARCWLQFATLQSFFKQPRLAFIPSGISSLNAFAGFFDLILCMGVIYHQRDPFTAVRQLFEATKPGGTVVLESLVVDQPGPYLLLPPERYAKMRNAWIIPTPDALVALMKRAGFKEVALHRFGPISTEEQRRTALAPYESLSDFLDPNDPRLTVEGFPAPHSAAVIAYR